MVFIFYITKLAKGIDFQEFRAQFLHLTFTCDKLADILDLDLLNS